MNSFTRSKSWTAKNVISFATLILLVATTSLSFAHEGKTLLDQSSFSVNSPGWETYSQRAEISPEFSVDPGKSLSGDGSLCLYGASNSSVRGCWRKVVEGVDGGAFYQFNAAFCASSIPVTHHKAFARLEWHDDAGNRIGNTREYAIQQDASPDGWCTVGMVRQAPQNARSAMIELFISHAPQGRVWWDNISLLQIPAPPSRKVKVATVNCRPGGNTTVAQTVAEFCEVASQAGAQGADIVCLGEGVNMIGVGRPEGGASGYNHIAEPIPGPTTDQLAKVAKKYGMYIVAALGEREGHTIYNTGVLIGRDGEIKGKYRKTHLPEGEYDQGVSPGDSYPVFETDFGKIGIMICWDSWFVDPARALAAAGAEIILVPIWGGNHTLMAARAIENHAWVVNCGYDLASRIYGPWGALLAEATEKPGVAVVEIDLNYPPPCPWPWPLSDTRQVLMQGSRYDIKIQELER